MPDGILHFHDSLFVEAEFLKVIQEKENDEEPQYEAHSSYGLLD